MTPARGCERPWLRAADDVAVALGSDLHEGLASETALARRAEFGPNRLATAPAPPAWRKLAAEFRDPLVYLLLAATAISLLTWALEGLHGVPFEAVVIAAILAANAVLGFAQKTRAERAVQALRDMTAATATVMRDGVRRRIVADDIVPGDLLVLAEGDAVTADGRLVEAASLFVAEAALTGESEPVLKDAAALAGEVALGDRTNMVFGGTAVTRGRGRAVVTATGVASEIGRIAELLGRTAEPRTPLQREVDAVGRSLGVTVLGIAAVVMATIVLTSDIDGASDLVDVLLVGVSLAVAAVPEGLAAVLSVVLALGVQRMARHRAVVKNLSSVETLGSASVICTDKTGTLTRNEMTLRRIVTRSGTVEVTGTGYRPDGGLVVDGRPIERGALADEARIVLEGGSLASDASLALVDGEWQARGDPTEIALLVAERKAGFADARVARYVRVGEQPFTAERKLMSTVQVDHADGARTVTVKGAPDVLLARCTHEQDGTRVVALDESRRRAILDAVDVLADGALRTLGVAYRQLDTSAHDVTADDLERDLVFAGLVGIMDPPRPEARAAVDDARRAGIRVVMITGDHPRTAARIAHELGIAGADTPALSGADLDRLDDAALREQARAASVYARVAPEHKLRIVDALQADGNVVAMTGDGVNDAPALKRADIGVAMGVAGTDVAKESANMVLADDNFATIVAAVREGRAIFANIRSFLRYLLSSNAGEVLTMFLGVVAAGIIGLEETGDTVAVPLLATQILWINLLTDSGPALALGLDPPRGNVMDRPPRRLTDRIIDREMRAGVVFTGFVMAVATLVALDVALPGGLVDGSGGLVEGRTMAFTTLVLAQLFNCFNARSDQTSAFVTFFSNPLLWAAIALSLTFQVAVVHLPVLQEAFDTEGLSAAQWLLCAAFASSVLWAVELRKLVRRP